MDPLEAPAFAPSKQRKERLEKLACQEADARTMLGQSLRPIAGEASSRKTRISASPRQLDDPAVQRVVEFMGSVVIGDEPSEMTLSLVSQGVALPVFSVERAITILLDAPVEKD